MNRNKLLTLLLVVSLAVNLALLTAAFYRRVSAHRSNVSHRPGPGEIQDDLAVRPEQRPPIVAIVRQFRIQSLNAKQDILAKRVEILEELGNPEYDAALIKTKTGELNQLENQLNERFIESLVQINALLDSRQRLDLLDRLSRSWFFFNGPARPEKGGQHE